MKKVLLLGASGSIGQQTLDIIDKNDDKFELIGFSVGRQDELVEPLLKKYPKVKFVYLLDPKRAFHYTLTHPGVLFFSKDVGLAWLIRRCPFDICVDALVGFVGLEPAILTLKKDKILCLANKEALVSG